jgi:hypothetical protein
MLHERKYIPPRALSLREDDLLLESSAQSDSDFNFPNLASLGELIDGFQVLANRYRMFSRASSSVLPWDQQPGKPGHETLKLSLDLFSTTFYFMTSSFSLTCSSQVQPR